MERRLGIHAVGNDGQTRATTQSIVTALEADGIYICDRTVSRILKELGYALRVNHKQLSATKHPQRNQQFQLIALLRNYAFLAGIPMISVDTKKKEYVGCFQNPGRCWGRKPTLVNDHDFRSLASGIAIPYAIYDLFANRGAFYVGTSYDTPEFAVFCIVRWWNEIGQYEYLDTRELYILADSGGSNGYRSRAWKYFLQHKLANQFDLTVTVAHYPSGASKWNPIEHRLFSEVSKHWAGIPLETLSIILHYLQTTTTRTGLTVTADLVEQDFEKGIKICDAEMANLNLQSHQTIPQWNYSIKPQTNRIILVS